MSFISRRPARRRRADRAPPTVFLDGPVLLLYLQPSHRAPALVRAGLILGDQTFVAALDHPAPRRPDRQVPAVAPGTRLWRPQVGLRGALCARAVVAGSRRAPSRRERRWR